MSRRSGGTSTETDPFRRAYWGPDGGTDTVCRVVCGEGVRPTIVFDLFILLVPTEGVVRLTVEVPPFLTRK